MTEVFNGVLQDGLGLVKCGGVDEVLIVEVHLIDASHNPVEFFLLGDVGLLDCLGLVDYGFVLGLFVVLLGLASHSNRLVIMKSSRG